MLRAVLDEAHLTFAHDRPDPAGPAVVAAIAAQLPGPPVFRGLDAGSLTQLW